MIEVDVVVPALNRKFDFSLDESTRIANIIEELIEMISQNEQKTVASNTEFVLCCPQSKVICDPNAALRDYGIDNGDLLMLV